MSELRYVCKSCGKAYKILTWFNKHVESKQHELDPVELLSKTPEIEFLKCEIAMLKRQFRDLKAKGFAYNGPAIERIRQDEHRPERDQFKIEFTVVIKELKVIFQEENFDYHKVLKPVDPLEEIELPPEIVIAN